ncbi:hypothetical protein [Kamptonema sp. UHCC 0994]|uniref:hypothetical protein n=1 Tax=Kamptonema sp. UHCC 0994 TaxID=3031329 RepID=UPI0023BA078B|nr:hypothetical protein [Kamptonema sp. UHCC 0994]MDF0555528.1 hypothetical protein [Kamptonema sp. UHCC 0994]
MIIVSEIFTTIAGRDRNVNYYLFSSNQGLMGKALWGMVAMPTARRFAIASLPLL